MSESTDDLSSKNAYPAPLAEERFIHQVVQLAPIFINVFDLQTERDIYIGPDVKEMLGYTRDEIAQMDDAFALWHPEDRNVASQHLARSRTATDGEVSEFEYRVRHRDGDWRWLMTRSVPFTRSDTGEVRQIVTATSDITERKEAERRLAYQALMLENVYDAIIATDAQLNITGWNRAAERIYGWTADQALGRNAQEVVGSETPASKRDEVLRLLVESGPQSAETVHHKKDGTRIDVEGSIMALQDAAGLVTGYVTTHRDITARKRAEEALHRAHRDLEKRVAERTEQLRRTHEALRESTRRIENILESITDDFWALDREWRFTYVNERALSRVRRAKHQELTREEVLGKNVWEAFPDLVGSVIYDKYHEALREQKTVHFEAYSPPSDRWVEVHVYPSENGLSAYSRDITERKRVEERLAYHACLLENVRDAVIGTDKQLLVTAWNKGAEELYGWRIDEVLGRHIWEVVPVDLSDEQRDDALKDLNEGRQFRVEAVTYGKGGMPVDVEGITIALRDERGLIIGYVNIRRDITERKRTQAALYKTQAELLHATRLAVIGELTTSIAHELRQPLTAIAANAGACVRWLDADRPNLDEVRAAAQRISNDAHWGEKLIEQTRRLAQKSIAQRTVFDINEAILEVLVLISGAAKEHFVVVHKSLAEAPLLVSGVRIQIQQVVLNLALNAIEAMEDVGDRTRVLTITSERADGNSVLVAVQDTGPGFAQQDRPRLFEAFYTTKREGLGLGLAISQSIIADHGGQLSATPNEQHGATFKVVLPTSASP